MNKKSGTNGQPFVGCATRSTCTRNLGAIWILDCLYNDLRLTAEKSPFCLSQTSLIRTHWLRKVGRLVELEVKCEPWIMNASVLLLTAVACARNEQETMDKLRMSAFINLCVGCATLPLPYIVKVIWVRIWPIQWHAMAFWRATGNFFFWQKDNYIWYQLVDKGYGFDLSVHDPVARLSLHPLWPLYICKLTTQGLG